MESSGFMFDSTTVIPEEWKRADVAVMPVSIYAAGREYSEGVDITPEEFIAFLETLKERPSTGVPGLGRFISWYERLLHDHGQVVYTIPSHKLTGLFDAAVQAAQQVAGATVVAVDPPEDAGSGLYVVRSNEEGLAERLAGMRELRRPLIVLANSGFASGGTGLVGVAGMRCAAAGGASDEVAGAMVAAKGKSNIYLILNTLEYIVDRVGQLRALLGRLLHVKPILRFKDGTLEEAGKARGKLHGKQRMLELLRQEVGERLVDVYVLHCLAEDEAQALAEQVKAMLNVRDCWVDNIGSTVSRYTGRGGLGIAFTVA